jgi:hypothetical protein
MKSEHVMKVVVSAVNFNIMDLTIASFNLFWQKLMLNIGTYYTEVGWLSHRTAIEIF